MRLLKLGVQGDDVERWENFLRGLYPDSKIVVDQQFTEITKEETQRFQSAVGFAGDDVDGVVGRMTYAEAMKLGFDPGIEDDRPDMGPNWPPIPNNTPSLSYDETAKLFGKFEYVPAPTKWNPEGIKITDGWEKDNIIKVNIPQLVGVEGAPKSGNVYLHKLIVDQTVEMFKAWEFSGLMPLVLTWAGSWVPRYIRGSRTRLSNHSWGTAFDINAAWNGLGRQPALKGKKGSVRELVGIANDHGYFWGGHWQRRPDGMHFQVGRII